MTPERAQQQLDEIRARQPMSDGPTKLADCLPLRDAICRSSTWAPPPAVPPLAYPLPHHLATDPAVMLRACALPPRAVEDQWDVVEDGTPWAAVYQRIAGQLGCGILIGLVGPWGTGKTVMAARLCREAIARGMRQPRYVVASAMLREFTASFNDPDADSEADVLKKYRGFGLLVIDEAHERAQSEYADRRMREVINERYGWQRDTVLISNQSPESFAAAMGEAVIDRMRQCGGLIVCDWPSYRGAR